jgi:hypothetical protein
LHNNHTEGAKEYLDNLATSLAPVLGVMRAKVAVMRGQKRVEDARKRAYDPRIHPFCTKVFTKMDGLPGQARQ